MKNKGSPRRRGRNHFGVRGLVRAFRRRLVAVECRKASDSPGPLAAALLWRQVAKAAKAVTSHRTPNCCRPRAKFQHCSTGQLERALPPHPGPLPQGEGATWLQYGLLSQPSVAQTRNAPREAVPSFSLSPRERAGVRGNEFCWLHRLHEIFESRGLLKTQMFVEHFDQLLAQERPLGDGVADDELG